MHTKRHTLKFLLGGIAACASGFAYANSEIIVYHSPD